MNSSANYPLESETNSVSDHKVVCLEARLARQKSFSWEVHQYMKVTPEGDELFKDLIKNESWCSVLECSPDCHGMAEEFHSLLQKLLENGCGGSLQICLG